MDEQPAVKQRNLSWVECEVAARSNVCGEAFAHFVESLHPLKRTDQKLVTMYPIPNGGIPAALIVEKVAASLFPEMKLTITHIPERADCYVDDIVDSGNTREQTFKRYGRKPFYALVDKTKPCHTLGIDRDMWVSFPWERLQKQDGPQDNVRRLLQYIGEDVEREGLQQTPDRVVKSFAKLFGGYNQKPEDVMTTFTDGACDEMVVLKGIEFFSTCEHHMLPFFGKAHIAYIPDGKVIGVSKIARLLEIFSRRLQIQEHLTKQIVDALMEHLKPKGAACVLEAQHLCMVARGVEKQGSTMTTSSLAGVFLKPEVRAEFYSIIQH